MTRKSNVEFITELMEFAQTGPMMQAFIMEACSRYAKQVMESDGKEWPENYIISFDLWKRVATELNEALDKRMEA